METFRYLRSNSISDWTPDADALRGHKLSQLRYKGIIKHTTQKVPHRRDTCVYIYYYLISYGAYGDHSH